jgi:peptidoglycan/xylan/chitin deacetylase (PgdA/CDA1 family)
MESTEETRPLSWPDEPEIYLTLDFECDYGTAVSRNNFEAARAVSRLTDVVERYSAPITCFLQTELLEEAPEAVNALASADIPVSFHAHSHTHPCRDDADVEYEVGESVERIRSEFGSDPIGYRFPDGNLLRSDYGVLASNGVSFSSSVFPSWRLGQFNNVRRARTPFRHVPTDVVEIPFTVHSDLIRVPVSISYMKFLGSPFDWLLRRWPPDTIIFDMHLHDFVVPEAFSSLPPQYRLIYSRNKHAGLDMFDRFLASLERRDYRFGELTELYERLSGDSPRKPRVDSVSQVQ